MGFLRRLLGSSDTSSANGPEIGLGSGRRLHSGLAMADCVVNIEAIIRSYPLPGTVTPDLAAWTPFVIAEWRWVGPQNLSPEAVITFTDSNGDVLFVAFRPDGGGAEIDVFPLGVGDERLSNLPIIGHMKQRDSSLTSIGVIPTDQLLVLPPRVPDHYVEEMLQTAGFSPTPHNLIALGYTIVRMFLGEAHQYIAAKDLRLANQFVQSRDEQAASIYNFVQSRDGYAGSIEKFCQGVLNDLAEWDRVVLFYIQNIPMMVRAVALLVMEKQDTIGEFELER